MNEQAIKAAAAEIFPFTTKANTITRGLTVRNRRQCEELLRKRFPPIDEKPLEEIAKETVNAIDGAITLTPVAVTYDRKAVLRIIRIGLRQAVRQQNAKYRKLVEAAYLEGEKSATPGNWSKPGEHWENSAARQALFHMDQPTDFQYLMAHDAMLQRDMKLPEEKP